MTEDVKSNGYSLKDLIGFLSTQLGAVAARLENKIDALDTKLDAKANLEDFLHLKQDVAVVSTRLTVIETSMSTRRETENEQTQKKQGFQVVWVPTLANLVINLVLIYLVIRK